VPSLDPDITLFGEEIAAELSRVIEGHLLEQKFETQIKWRLRCLNLERSQIEVAFDEGFVVPPCPYSGAERRELPAQAFEGKTAARPSTRR